MRKLLPFFAALLLIAGCAAPAQENSYRQVTAEEAIALMEKESGYIILDVRTAQEYSEKHIPNAVNIPNESIGTEEIPALPDIRLPGLSVISRHSLLLYLLHQPVLYAALVLLPTIL